MLGIYISVFTKITIWLFPTLIIIVIVIVIVILSSIRREQISWKSLIPSLDSLFFCHNLWQLLFDQSLEFLLFASQIFDLDIIPLLLLSKSQLSFPLKDFPKTIFLILLLLCVCEFPFAVSEFDGWVGEILGEGFVDDGSGRLVVDESGVDLWLADLYLHDLVQPWLLLQVAVLLVAARRL